ncbi:MAG: hypothetical protein ABI759_22975 [Candidatus Solibacter sp.]
MIAGVKGSAVFSALLILLPWSARAADDMAGAVRELARKTIAFAGRGEPVSINWQNASPLTPAEFGQVRIAMDAAFREAGTRVSGIAPMVEAKITLSANTTQFLLIEEARKADDRQLWIASWKRTAAGASTPIAAISLDKRLVLEQEEQFLDLVPIGEDLLALTPTRLILRKADGAQSQPVASPRPWPRDLRGHLRVSGGGFKAYLPGVSCTGTLDPFTAECRPSDEPWTLEAGSRGVLLANFSPGRNYFDGRLVTSAGPHPSLAPFFTAASAEEAGKTYFVLAMLDGRAQIFDAAFEPVGAVPAWGSDLAGTESRCGTGSQILATSAATAREPDFLRAFGLSNRTLVPLSPPLDLPGPVTALWPRSGNAAVAVVRNLSTGMFQAYLITVNCGG